MSLSSLAAFPPSLSDAADDEELDAFLCNCFFFLGFADFEGSASLSSFSDDVDSARFLSDESASFSLNSLSEPDEAAAFCLGASSPDESDEDDESSTMARLLTKIDSCKF